MLPRRDSTGYLILATLGSGRLLFAALGVLGARSLRCLTLSVFTAHMGEFGALSLFTCLLVSIFGLFRRFFCALARGFLTDLG